WSMGVLVREVTEVYEALASGRAPQLPALPIQYADYAAWQREWLEGEVLAEQLGYWREQLAGLAPVLELPLDRPRPAMQTFRGRSRSVSLPADLVSGVESLARRHGATSYMALMAGLKALLTRVTGQTDVCVGTYIANRHRPGVENLIGFFVNTLALRTDLSGEPGFGALVEREREVVLGGYAHQDLPFERLLEELSPERALSHTPLFQVMLVLQNQEREMSRLPVAAADERLLATGSVRANFDLTFWLWPQGEGLRCDLEYNVDLFDEPSMVRLLARYRRLLSAVLADPDQPLSELPLLGSSEQRQLLGRWSGRAGRHRREQLVHGLFEARSAASPDPPALRVSGRDVSYGELDLRANQLAHRLLPLGVGPEVRVGVALEEASAVPVVLLAVWKAGGVAVPVDPQQPVERSRQALADAGVGVLVSQGEL
ncbi:MAG: AMP-binding protein, partial [Colwellia sp.]|nr:AMP-binding protein [Colwellia sp.]